MRKRIKTEEFRKILRKNSIHISLDFERKPIELNPPRVAMKKIILSIAIAACALAAQFAPAAPPPDVKEIMSKPLTDIPGKEGLVLTVTYPPGGGDEIHRHNAHAFVYVLEGSIVMQLRGAEPVTVKAGEGFYEGPNDVHIVGRSASDSKPAKFVVFLVKNQGVPAVLPAK
jgi:quercetin dioxygenase-like cupin family protein